MIRRIEKGDRITSEMLNQIKRGVSQRILGGKGINVQNVGGRTVISRKREQIVPQLGGSGHVWGLNSNLRVRWAYDATNIETQAGGVSTMFSCPDLCATANEVCASFSPSASPADACKTVAQFTTAGTKEWAFMFTDRQARSCAACMIYQNQRAQTLCTGYLISHRPHFNPFRH